MYKPNGRKMGLEYFSRAFSLSSRDLADTAQENIPDPFDTIVGTGLSGTIAAVRLSTALRKNCLIVRKPDDQSNHSGSRVEGFLGERFIVVDDFIGTGNTVTNALRTLRQSIDNVNEEWMGTDYEVKVPTCVGFYEYERQNFQTVDSLLDWVYGERYKAELRRWRK